MEGNPVKGGGATRPGLRGPTVLGSTSEMPIADEEIAGISAAELREFLEADDLEVPADPDFKERLRRRLWELVLNRLEKSEPG
jgi:hypothetical protein